MAVVVDDVIPGAFEQTHDKLGKSNFDNVIPNRIKRRVCAVRVMSHMHKYSSVTLSHPFAIFHHYHCQQTIAKRLRKETRKNVIGKSVLYT